VFDRIIPPVQTENDTELIKPHQVAARDDESRQITLSI
jgi:hypothetical protein